MVKVVAAPADQTPVFSVLRVKPLGTCGMTKLPTKDPLLMIVDSTVLALITEPFE